MFYVDFVRHQTINVQAVSADVFSVKEDIYVAMASPGSDSCVVMEWDHIEMNFRKFDNIPGESVAGCKSVVIRDHVLLLVARRLGGSHLYRFDKAQNRFVPFQTLLEEDEGLEGRLKGSPQSPPNVSQEPADIEVFRLDGDWYLALVLDGTYSTVLYKWTQGLQITNKTTNQTTRAGESRLFSFLPYQSLSGGTEGEEEGSQWSRTTDIEFVSRDDGEAGSIHYLVVSGRSRATPALYLWSRTTRRFQPHGKIPASSTEDQVLGVKAFCPPADEGSRDTYLALACYIGDSRVLRWTTTTAGKQPQFTEVQVLPSRGAMVLQPFVVMEDQGRQDQQGQGDQYLALGSDFSFTRIYRWDSESRRFARHREVYVQSPRSFSPVVDSDLVGDRNPGDRDRRRRSFVFSCSLRGKSTVFEHLVVDLSL
ncbi:hypothetical protein NHX12_017648 [Muraenolepis orangiensis]|uniref:Uncharacterized protein n=1 Tax=Muraenolepis orangiensis TaxID=630683 RepID=A0A9Q0EYC0_9TELE|nr:hypothetical protein NHX12_017648 [Muraenolepis orangiensis]